MFERIKDCLCHPRYIGKYNKDKAGIVLLTIFLFFALSIGMLGARVYTEEPFESSTALSITSYIIRHGENDVSYDTENHQLSGSYFEVGETGIQVVILPGDEKINMKRDTITIVLKEGNAQMYYGGMPISKLAYENIEVSSFQLNQVAANHPTDTYNFKIFLNAILDSSRVFFQTYSFIQGVISNIVFYLICVVFCYVLSIAINPTIQKGVRAKLCFYDGCVFFVGSFFGYLFNVNLLIYIALALPLFYSFITFRHIIKVVIRR